MAQDQTIEAARSRIQRLIDEIAALSKKDIRSEEYFAQFLTRAVKAVDARGGAVWLVGRNAGEAKNEFQLAAEVAFDSSLFQRDEHQRATILRVLSEVVEQRRNAVLPPSSAPEPGSLEEQLQQLRGTPATQSPNRTPFPFLHAPLLLNEQVIGVLQVWLPPQTQTQNYPEFLTFLTSLAVYVEQHLQSRRLGSLVLETQRLQHLLRFSTDIAGSLEPLEVARLTANYSRDLLGCERCSVAFLHHGSWRMLAISGQETVEQKSSTVKAMLDFAEAHTGTELVLISKNELLAQNAQAAQTNAPLPPTTDPSPTDHPDRPPAIRTDAVDLAYFEVSHVLSAALAPLLNEQKQIVGVLFCESTTESLFAPPAPGKEQPSTTRLAEWIAAHSTRSLLSAYEHHSLPLLPISRSIRNAQRLLLGDGGRRSRLKAYTLAAAILITCLYPKLERIDGNCSLLPSKRAAIVPEIAGRIEKVLVREGQHVEKGTPVAQLETRRIETELAANEQERQRLLADAERYRSLGDEASAQVSLLQSRVTEQNEKKLRTDIDAATLRSPITGAILTKDLELRAGEFIQPGSPFAEVAALDHWDLIVDVNEKAIGRVEKALPKTGAPPKDIHFILYSQSAHNLRAFLQDHRQISSSAFPRESENVFLITANDVPIPQELQNAMRPGLTGRARIDLGRKPLLWLYLERIWDWMRLRMIG